MGSGTATERPPPETAPSTVLRGTHTGPAGSRDYLLYVPDVRPDLPASLIVMLHGGTQSADDFARGTRMHEAAERENALVLYPEQSRAVNGMGSWQWFQPADQQRGSGEPSLVAGMTLEVAAEYAVDHSRVYVAGLSAGGAMAAVMAATYPECFAAVGVHSGLPYGCAQDVGSAFAAMQVGASTAGTPGGAVPMIVFHGDSDYTVAYGNAGRLADQTLDALRSATPHSSLTATTSSGQAPGERGWTRTAHCRTDGLAVVENWRVHGAGHAWSGGSPKGSYTDPAGPDATAAFLAFFLTHRRDR